MTDELTTHASPGRRAWRRFRSNRLGYVSLVLFAILFGMSLAAELLSNDRPLAVAVRLAYWPLDWKMLALIVWLMGGCVAGLTWALVRNFYGM